MTDWPIQTLPELKRDIQNSLSTIESMEDYDEKESDVERLKEFLFRICQALK